MLMTFGVGSGPAYATRTSIEPAVDRSTGVTGPVACGGPDSDFEQLVKSAAATAIGSKACAWAVRRFTSFLLAVDGAS
jgi:hypothetical protein